MDFDKSPDPLGTPFTLEAYKEVIGEGFRSSSGTLRQPMEEAFLSNLDQRVCSPQGCDFEYEYPYFIRSPDGLYHRSTRGITPSSSMSASTRPGWRSNFYDRVGIGSSGVCLDPVCTVGAADRIVMVALRTAGRRLAFECDLDRRAVDGVLCPQPDR